MTSRKYWPAACFNGPLKLIQGGICFYGVTGHTAFTLPHLLERVRTFAG
jgi:hypothetical protein